ncbi:MAG TPA: hypothetical protein VH024_09630 [Candidatus Angelobacter sp.]|jgi:hypothetical protein|nr:hypothetical protein [Candidatus Angelobacter sp.]
MGAAFDRRLNFDTREKPTGVFRILRAKQTGFFRTLMVICGILPAFKLTHAAGVLLGQGRRI